MPLPSDLVALPITAVTCMEDRAQIEREGAVRVVAGVSRLRVGPVTPLAVDRSLRAELTGPGRVVDTRVVRRYTPPPPGEPGQDASGLRRELHALARELTEVRLLEQRQVSALAIVEQARDDVHRDIVQGAGGGDADPERWADRLDRVESAAEPRISELHTLRRRLHDIRDELAEVRAALAALETTPMVMSAYLELVVEADADGEAALRVSH
jgi:hypothetical protein